MEKREIVRLVVEIEKDLHRKLKVYAVQHDKSIRELIEGQIKALLGEE